MELAAEEPDSCQDFGGEALRAANAATEKQMAHRLEVARAQLKVFLDRRQGRPTDEASVKLAQEDC